jgi:ABC-type spermidine/putrescine transport system permease subunit II
LFLVTDQVTLPVKYLLFMRQQLLPSMAAVGTLLLVLTLLVYLILNGGTRVSARWRRSYLVRREEGNKTNG